MALREYLVSMMGFSDAVVFDSTVLLEGLYMKLSPGDRQKANFYGALCCRGGGSEEVRKRMIDTVAPKKYTEHEKFEMRMDSFVENIIESSDAEIAIEKKLNIDFLLLQTL